MRPAIPTLLAGSLLLVGGPAASATSNPDQADGKGIATIQTLNMCMWGNLGCFDKADADDPDYPASIESTAEKKRRSVVQQFDRHSPDIMTVTEACSEDMRRVQKKLAAAGNPYDLEMVETGGGTDRKPRECRDGETSDGKPVDRGVGVNAIFARDIVPDSRTGGYFESGTVDGKPADGYRSYLCVQVNTDQYKGLRGCTAHLSTQEQDSIFTGKNANTLECGVLRSKLEDLDAPTLFAGDVNRQTRECVPDGFHGLRDLEMTEDGQKENPNDGVQHVYYSAPPFSRQSCGWSYDVSDTDHEGFLLELGATTPPDRPGCIRTLY